MKVKTKTALTMIPLFVALAWSAFAQSDIPAPGTEADENAAAVAAEAKLDQAVAEVTTRLHMPAMLEISEDPAQEAEIAELHQSGWIVDATVDEVESALQAAAATPELEDNIAALILAHRASCRFFVEE